MLQVAFSASCSLGEHDNRSVLLKTLCIILHWRVTCFNCELEVLQYKVHFSSFCFATEKSSLQSGWLLCYDHQNTLTVTQVSTIPNVSVCLYLWHASFFFSLIIWYNLGLTHWTGMASPDHKYCKHYSTSNLQKNVAMLQTFHTITSGSVEQWCLLDTQQVQNIKKVQYQEGKKKKKIRLLRR